MKIDLVIHCRHMFTMQGEGVGYRENHSLAVNGGKIVAIGPRAEIEGAYTAEKTFDEPDKAVLPGFIDCHMHMRHAVIRGVSQDIVNWMWDGMAPFESQTTPEAKESGGRLALAEGILAGTTTFGDDGPDIGGSIRNIIRFGVRGNVSPRIREVDFALYKPDELYNFYPELGEKSLADSIRLFDLYNGTDGGRVRVLFGPQGADFVSTDLMKKVCRIARERGTRVHMHLSQGRREDIQIEKRYGLRPIPYLDSLGAIDGNLIGVHLTSATDEEVALVASRGTSMVLCPSSIAVIRGSVPPAKQFHDAGGIVGLGTDQSPGNNGHNMFNEMKLAAVLNKCKYDSPLVYPAWKVLRMATIEGARAIGLGDVTGSLETGKAADIILINLREPALSPVITHPMRNIVPNIVYAARGHEVDSVIVAGRVVLEHRKPQTFVLDEIIDDVQRHAEATADKAAEAFYRVDSEIAGYMRKDQL